MLYYNVDLRFPLEFRSLIFIDNNILNVSRENGGLFGTLVVVAGSSTIHVLHIGQVRTTVNAEMRN